MTTHHSSPPQSLPSFAQVFSPSSLSNIHGGNSLPPIQARSSFERFSRKETPSSRDQSRHPSVENPAPTTNGRKRGREEASSTSNSGSDRQSPRVVRVKEEDDHDMPDASPPPPTPAPSQSRPLLPRPSEGSFAGAPPPSLLGPPSKKRRVTVSGGLNPLNTDVRALSQDPSHCSPISPAVIGFTVGGDPAALEQVRSMLTVKQKQKALIEQRRGSVAGIINGGSGNPSAILNEQRRGSVAGIVTVANSSVHRSPRAPVGVTRLSSTTNVSSSPEDRPMPAQATRALRRSPNFNPGGSSNPGPSRRAINAPPPAPLAAARPPSPEPMIVPTQQTATITAGPSTTAPIEAANNLPPPPISFARRRAGQFGSLKGKPADIVISPRDAQTPEQLAPSIQSAPPVPHHAQGLGVGGRLSMALPRIPAAMESSQHVQRVTSGRVPPTPTRLTQAMQRSSGPSSQGPAGGAASVPISATLVPPTPTALHRPGYVGEKSAFLAPFEMFYDSLNDSKQMKNWLGEQLQRSNALIQTLKTQQEGLEDMVERAVEKRVGRMREEVGVLRGRVEELEGALRLARGEDRDYGRRPSVDPFGSKGKFVSPRGGLNGPSSLPALEPPATYTFPPVAPPPRIRKVSPPGWGHDPDREGRDSQGHGTSERPSPPPPFEDDRRLSVSSSRYESQPPRPQAMESSLPRGPSGSQTLSRGPSFNSHTQNPVNSKPHLTTPQKQPSHTPRPGHQERPNFSRHRSSDTLHKINAEEGARSNRSRTNSIVMSPPDETIRRLNNAMDER